MRRLPIRFLTPDVVTEVGEHELQTLRNELIRIADGAPRFTSAAALADKLDSLTGAAPFEPDSLERFALLRATDHLRNLDHRGELLTLRDRLIGTGDVRPIAYQLRFLDARPPEGFASYSLAYEPRDRLVTPANDQLRVIRVDDEDGGELLVDDWEPAYE